MTPDSSELSAISRLFSSAVFREMAEKGRSPLFAKLLREIRVFSPKTLFRVANAFDVAFDVLRAAGHRDEYIYRAALTHKVLLGIHSLNTASMLSEFRVGGCKADVAILNGTATVYEIKSERDSLSRLARQIEAYKTVFAKVYVIAGESHVDAILSSTSKDVGVLKLSNRYRIGTVREAKDLPHRISPLAVLDSIRTSEAKKLLEYLSVPFHDVPNTMMRGELEKAFQKLDAKAVHVAMVHTLKQTRNLLPLSKLVDSLPDSLHAAALSLSVRRSRHARLVEAVNTRMSEAVDWA